MKFHRSQAAEARISMLLSQETRRDAQSFTSMGYRNAGCSGHGRSILIWLRTTGW